MSCRFGRLTPLGLLDDVGLGHQDQGMQLLNRHGSPVIAHAQTILREAARVEVPLAA